MILQPKRLPVVRWSAWLGRSVDWPMVLPCSIMLISSVVVCCGWIVMGNCLVAVKNHPENTKSLDSAVNRANPSQHQDSCSDFAILLVEPFNGGFQITNDRRHLNVINGEHTNDGAVLNIRVKNLLIAESRNELSALLRRHVPNGLLAEGDIESFEWSIHIERVNRPND